MEVACKHLDKTLSWDAVLPDCNINNDRAQVSRYEHNLKLSKVPPGLRIHMLEIIADLYLDKIVVTQIIS
jgi:hypothetical protein